MQKAYNRINWENYPSEETPVNEENLNKIDVGLNEVDNRLITIDTTKLNKTAASGMMTNFELDTETGIITLTFYSGSKVKINTNLAKIALNITYDAENERLVLTMPDGTKTYVDMAALITQYEFVESDTITFEVTTDGKVKADLKKNSITGDYLEPNYLANVTAQAELAATKANAAANSASTAQTHADNAKNYAEEAKASADKASEVTNITYATKEKAGILRGGENYIDESGTLTLTKKTNATALENGYAGGLKLNSIYGKSEKKYSKNLLKNEVLSQTIGDLTITRNADGSLTFNGTVTEAVILDFLAEISEAGTYYASGCPIADTNYIVMTTTPNGVVTPTRGSTDEITLDITASGTLKYVLTLRTGLVLDNVTWYPMVSTESGATYVPYECNIVSATENGYLGVGVTDGSLTLVSQTSRVDAPLGDMCKFSVDVIGEGLTYQWQFVDANGSWSNSGAVGAKTNSMQIEMQERRDGQKYRCTIIDANSNVLISNTATMNLGDEYKEEKTFVMKSAGKTQSMDVFVGSPRLIQQSGDFVGVVGKQSSIGVIAEGDSLTYQWYYKRTDTEWTKWEGKTNPDLFITVQSNYSQAKFYCEITDANGNMVTSDIITLTLGAVASGTYKIVNRTANMLAGVPVDSDGNYTDENGQQWICDEIDFESGKYIKRIHKVVFDGSDDEVWSLNGTNSLGVNNFKITIKPYQDKTKTAFFICNNLTVQTSLIGVTKTEGIIISYTTNGACYIRKLVENTPDVATLRAWLAANPVEVAYVLAEPIETDLTDGDLIAVKSLLTYDGKTQIVTDSEVQLGFESEYGTSKVGAYALMNSNEIAKKDLEPVSAKTQNAINEAYVNSNYYTDEKIAELINGAPTILDTLKEIADAMAENEDVVTVLENAIGSKADKNEFSSHVNNTSNPHGVTAAQIGALTASDIADNLTSSDKKRH